MEWNLGKEEGMEENQPQIFLLDIFDFYAHCFLGQNKEHSYDTQQFNSIIIQWKQ